MGGYVSAKLKSEEWGSKVVTQFAEYVKVHAPEVKGFSRCNIYNMVMLYDEYSSPNFIAVVQQFMPQLIGQIPSAQIEETEIVQPLVGQRGCVKTQMNKNTAIILIVCTHSSN